MEEATELKFYVSYEYETPSFFFIYKCAIGGDQAVPVCPPSHAQHYVFSH